MQVDVHLLQKELTSNKEAVSTNLTSFHQYDDKVCYFQYNPMLPESMAAFMQKAQQCICTAKPMYPMRSSHEGDSALHAT